PYGLDPSEMTAFGDLLATEVLFNGYDATFGHGLWVTDGTAAGTHELTGISGAYTGGLDPFDLTVFNRWVNGRPRSELLISGHDANDHRGLWVSDGTAVGTHELAVSGGNPIGLYPSELTVFTGEVLFRGTDASGIPGLWVTDGTAAGTHELTGI